MNALRVDSIATATARIWISLRRIIAPATTKAADSMKTAASSTTTATNLTAATTASDLTKNAKTVCSKRKRTTMPSEPFPMVAVGDVLILRDGFRNIAEDTDKLQAQRKHARTMVQLLDEVLMWRETAGEETE